MNSEQIFLSAIKDRDGTVNVGYLMLFKVMRTFWFELGMMTAGAAIAFYSAWPKPDDMVKILSAYGTAVGIVAAANFTTSLVGIAAFLWGDRPVAGTATTTTTTTATAPVAAAAIPAPVTIAGVTGTTSPIAQDQLLNAGRGVEPMPDKIAATDVGKETALVSRQKPKRRKRGRKA